MTLDELDYTDDLAVLDYVADFLLKQGHRATDLLGYYCLRNILGHKSALGCLIKDNEYDPAMEKDGIVRGLKRYWPHLSLNKCNEKLLIKLQTIYYIDKPSEWEEQFKTLRRTGNISIKESVKDVSQL